VQLPSDAFRVSNDGRRATLRADDVPVIDSFQFGGSMPVPATVNLNVTWQATGPRQPRGKGSAVPATDPAAFLGSFAPARSTASFSGVELGFSFRTNPGASTDRGYAEMGTERNGIFLR
jgi:hypothetical protein